MIRREHAHILLKGRRHRRGVRGHRRNFHLNVLISPQLQLCLMIEAARNHASVGMWVEQALWKALGRVAARKGARLRDRLRHANALINEVVGSACVLRVAGTLKVPGQASPVNVHEKEPRQHRRNQISQKAAAAFDEVYDLAQAEALAAENQTRAEMYMVLARLAEVNEALLKGASDEEVMVEIEKLREEQERFEESTRILEEEAKESAAAK